MDNKVNRTIPAICKQGFHALKDKQVLNIKYIS